jgi:hypothetical protein
MKKTSLLSQEIGLHLKKKKATIDGCKVVFQNCFKPDCMPRATQP